jgi:hypothetical protein
MSLENMAAAAQDPKNLPVEFEFDNPPAHDPQRRARRGSSDGGQNLVRHRQTGRYVGYSENDPDPIIVWSKLLGVRPSDVVTKGFDIGYLTSGPLNPSDYLAHNHRVLCYMVTGLSSSWEGLHAQDFDPRWSRREWSARQFAKQLQIADWLASRFLETDLGQSAL